MVHMSHQRRPFPGSCIIVLVVIVPWSSCSVFSASWSWCSKGSMPGSGRNSQKQFKPFYWWHFVTHDGRDLGYEHKGAVTAYYTRLRFTPICQISILIISQPMHTVFESVAVIDHSIRLREWSWWEGPRRSGRVLRAIETVVQLAQRLNVEVINAAVIGHGSGQELTYLLTELVDLHPDVVIALDGWE